MDGRKAALEIRSIIRSELDDAIRKAKHDDPHRARRYVEEAIDKLERLARQLERSF